jgi:HEAT repeat protein
VSWANRLGGVAMLTLGLTGCASFWDEVTSRDFHVKNLWDRPDPMTVLRDSSDGAKRGQALAALEEPLQNGGTPQDQEVYLKILRAAATEDREPLCRLGAVRALATYRDPRAVKILEDVYLQRLPFTTELNTVVRQQALASLEQQSANPEARHLLIRVARQPGPAGNVSSVDRQQTVDERLTAVRALGRFKQPDAAEALIYVLETEKDVALRHRAHQSLQEATGKSLPPDAQEWRNALATPRPSGGPNVIQRVLGWKKD